MQRKHVVFMGIIINAIVMLFTVNSESFPHQRSIEQKIVHKSVLIFCNAASGLPKKNEHEGSDFYFRATPSFTGQSYYNSIQFSTKAGLLFELFLKGSGTDILLLTHPLQIDDRLLITLFSVVISPNAP